MALNIWLTPLLCTNKLAFSGIPWGSDGTEDMKSIQEAIKCGPGVRHRIQNGSKPAGLAGHDKAAVTIAQRQVGAPAAEATP